MLPSHAERPTPRRSSLPFRVLGFVWRLPTNVIGHLAGMIVSGGSGLRVSSPAASARLYRVRDGLGLDWIGAVTLGNAILYRDRFVEGPRGKLIIAHELAHTRQHDWLGPLYLPLHMLAQTASLLISLGRGPARFSRIHDHNPLEQTFICLSAGSILELEMASTFDIDAYSALFGVPQRLGGEPPASS